jgi:hypothetical protein
MSKKSNSHSRSVEQVAIVPVTLNSITPEPSQADRLDVCLNNLRVAYDLSAGQATTLLSTMIEVGRCVVEVIKSFPNAEAGGKRLKPKNQWTVLELNDRSPFGWVQALRYKKIFEKKDELDKKLKESVSDLVGSITVETAYRLLGEPRPKTADFDTTQPKPFFTGTLFGVSSVPLETRQKELSDELKANEEEAERLNKKVQDLRELEAAYGFVRTFLAKPKVFEMPPRIKKDWINAFGRVAKERKEVKTAYELLQVSAQCPTTGAASSSDLKSYRSWVLNKYENEPQVAVEKLTMFAHNPEVALESDSDLKRYRDELAAAEATKRVAKKAAATAARKAWRDEEKKAVAAAKAQFRKDHPRRPAHAA